LARWPRVLKGSVTYTDDGARALMAFTWEPHGASAAEIACFFKARSGPQKGWVSGFDKLEEVLAEVASWRRPPASGCVEGADAPAFGDGFDADRLGRSRGGNHANPRTGAELSHEHVRSARKRPFQTGRKCATGGPRFPSPKTRQKQACKT
jgi:hypothetical protein